MIEYFIVDYLNITHGFIYLFANYFIAAGVPLLLGDFKAKPRWKCALTIALEIIICIVLMELLASVYWAIFRSDGFVPFVCGFIVLVLYAVIRCKRKPAVRILQASVYYGLCCLAIDTTMSMGSLFGEPGYYLQWVMIAANAVMIFSAVYILRVYSVDGDMIFSPLFVITIAAISALCLVFTVVRMEFDIDPAASLVLSVIFIFIYVFIYFIISYLIRKSYADARKLTDELMRNSDREVLRLSSENLEALHQMRHELKNQYAMMKTFLDSGDYKKLKKYFSEYSDKIEETVSFKNYGNETINAILNVEHSRAGAAGVELECKVAVSERLLINDIDLCSLIMNLINNAVEYYEGNPDFGEKKIIAEILQINETLLVNVSNPILPEHAQSALTLKTNKKNKSMHGHGSKVVALIVDKYCGSINYEFEHGNFVVSAILSNKQGAN